MLEINETYEVIIDDLSSKDYTIVDYLFSPILLEGLLANIQRKVENDALRRAGIGNRFNFQKVDDIRTDEIQWLSDQTDDFNEKNYLFQVEEFYNYLNRTCFTGISQFECHYAHFEEGAFFKKHVDRFKNDDSRKFSIITYLNKNWELSNGGQLRIYSKDTADILPTFGKTVIFRSHILPHEVLPANQSRYSITGWLK